MISSPKSSAVFLDRDGVLNKPIIREGRPFAAMNLDELEVLPGVAEACTALRRAGFLLVMVTNQPEITRGNLAADLVDSMNQKLAESLQLDVVKLCPHDDWQNCHCRKPKDGLLREVERDHKIDLGTSFMVGDRWRDIAAGHSAGCKTIFIDYAYVEAQPDNPDYVANSLLQATQWILQTKDTFGGNNADETL